MINPEDSKEQLKKYFNKLSRLVMEHKRGLFSKSKIIDKKTIDDIICCIDASFPPEYKDAVKSINNAKIKSWQYYKQLLPMIKRKPMFQTNAYAVDGDKAPTMIRTLLKALEADFREIYSDN